MQREQRDDDAAWQAIIDNYGDRVLDPGEDDLDPPGSTGADVDPMTATDRPEPARAPRATADEQPAELDEDADPWDRFVPPTPPPLPRPPLGRLLAWLGVFGAPAILLVVVVAGVDLPTLIGWVLVGSFVAGFGYLVATMSSEPRDPWDNGAQL